MDWYFDVLKKYATFSGRARRKEYWMFLLFHSIMIIGLVFLELFLLPESEGGVVASLYLLGTFLPYLAVSVRRLHDTNWSGLWLFISLVPIVGAGSTGRCNTCIKCFCRSCELQRLAWPLVELPSNRVQMFL